MRFASLVIKDSWIRGSCVAAALFMAVMLFAGAKSAADIPLYPPQFDKVVHFLYFGLMAGLLSHGVGRTWLWVPLVLVPAIGGADEWNQSTIVGRDASIWDWFADELGTVVAVAAYWRMTGRRAGETKTEA